MLYKCEIEVVKCKIFARLHADIPYTQIQNKESDGHLNWTYYMK